MTQEQPKAPRFTAVITHSGPQYSYRRRRSRRYSAHGSRDEYAGLLFEPVDGLTADKLATSPELKALLGELLVVTDCGYGLLVHANLAQVPTPDKASQDDIVYYTDENKLRRLPVLRRFSQCTEPTRDLLGCGECSYKGLACLTGLIHGTGVDVLKVPENRKEDFDLNELQELLKDGVTTLAGHVYVSPVLLAPEGEHFVGGARPPEAIDWTAEEGRRESRKSAAQAAAKTRNFKKTECAKCPARAGGCVAVRWCTGAFPTPAEITQRVLEAWLPYIDGQPDKSHKKLEPWQIYALMNLGGEIGECRYYRRKVALGRLARNSDGLIMRVVAYAGKTDERYWETTDWAELRKRFPRLPEGPGSKLSERPSDEAMAYYFGAMEQGRMGAVRRGFQGYVSDPIAWLRTEGDRLEIGRCRPRYIVFNYPETVGDWSKFYQKFGDMPVKRKNSLY